MRRKPTSTAARCRVTRRNSKSNADQHLRKGARSPQRVILPSQTYSLCSVNLVFIAGLRISRNPTSPESQQTPDFTLQRLPPRSLRSEVWNQRASGRAIRSPVAHSQTWALQPTRPASARSRLLCRRESFARLARSGSFTIAAGSRLGAFLTLTEWQKRRAPA
jgi:hypothetical protein